MRIISGDLKGRRFGLKIGRLPVRPMTDRIKETVFNVLAPYFFENCRFLDLFSGTGSLALEALSRGAGEAHVVEKHPLCIKMIRQNAKILPDSKKLVIHKKDVFLYLQQHRDSTPGNQAVYFKEQILNKSPFDIIIADPPFALKSGQAIVEALQNSVLAAKGTVIVIETGQSEDLKYKEEAFYLFSKKSFSDKKIWFYERL